MKIRTLVVWGISFRIRGFEGKRGGGEFIQIFRKNMESEEVD